MDGVLVDVTESYRETISRHGRSTSPARRCRATAIQDYKNQGGWNDDWALSHQHHRGARRQREVACEEVVEYFQAIFHGRRQ